MNLTGSPTVCIVGGGISGLATAWFLTARRAAHVLLLEAGSRLGGKVRTEPLAGLPVESGPDGFLAEPAVVALCEELGLGAELLGTLTSEAYLWNGDSLQPLRAEDSPRGEQPKRLLTVRGGLERLVEALEVRLTGVDVRRCSELTHVHRVRGGSFTAHLRSGHGRIGDQVDARDPVARHREDERDPGPAARRPDQAGSPSDPEGAH